MPKKDQETLDEQLTKLRKYVEDWEEALSVNLAEQETDSRYYHGKQWTREEMDNLDKKGQPIITKNEIKKKINSVAGHEIRNRTDPIAEPRTAKHGQETDAATDCLRYIDDNTKFDRKVTQSSLDVFKVGTGAMITQVCQEKMEITNTQVPWNRVFHDPHSREADFSDGLYLGIIQYRDKDDLASDPQYADAKDMIGDITFESQDSGGSASSATDDRPRGWYDSDRKRVRVIEIYYKEGAQSIDLAGKKIDLVGPVWKVAHFIERGFLIKPTCVKYLDWEEEEKGIIRNMCPLTMVSGYINDENERYGIVRDLRSPQDIINKTASKILYSLNVNGAIGEKGAVLNKDEFIHKLTQPDGFAEVEDDALREGRLQLRSGTDLASGNMEIMRDAQMQLDSIGPSTAMQGLGPNAQGQMSGRLFIAQQQQATMELGLLFDNLTAFRLEIYRKEWLLAKQFWTQEKWLRVRDDIKTQVGWRHVHINKRITKREHFEEMVEKGVDPETALRGLFQEEEINQAFQEMGKEIQQSDEYNREVMDLRQQGQEPDPEDLQAQVFEKFLESDYMKEIYVQNDIAKLDVDIIIDERPENTLVEHEEFQELARLAQTIPAFANLPMEFWIEISGVRAETKAKVKQLAGSNQPSEEELQAQQQQMQLQMQSMQAQIEKLMADTQKAKADAMKSQAQAQEIAGKAQLAPMKAQVEIYKTQATGMNQEAQAGVHASDAKTNPYGGKSE